MRLADDGTLRLSPSDLAAHLACAHLTQLAAAVQRGEIEPPPPYENAHADLIARKGDEHEAAFLAAARGTGPRHRRDRATKRTAASRRPPSAPRRRCAPGAEVVYQGVLASDRWRGIADFLVRVDEPSDLGPFSYEAWDTKLARQREAERGAPAHLLLARARAHPGAPARADAGRARHRRGGGAPAGRLRGVLPPRPRAARGGDRRARRRRTRTPSTTAGSATSCCVCDERWERRRPPRRGSRASAATRSSASSSRGSRRSRRSATRPPGTTVPHMSAATFETLRHQAALQLAARRTGTHRYELLPPEERRGLGLLPAPSPGDLFYDIEGDPFWEPGRGLEYLHGITDADGRFTAIWAHDRDEERRALERAASASSTSASPRTRTCTSTTTPPTRPRRSSASPPSTGSSRTSSTSSSAARSSSTCTRSRARRCASRTRATRSRRCASSSWTPTPSSRAGTTRSSLYEQWVAERDQAILDADRALQRGGLPLEPAPARLAARAEGGGGGAVRRRDPVAARARGRGSRTRRPPSSRRRARSSARALQATGDAAHALMGDLLEYHRREARPVWWWFFARTKMTPEELVEDSESIGCLEPDGSAPEEDAKSLVHGFRFPVQQQKLDVGDDVYDPVTMRWARERSSRSTRSPGRCGCGAGRRSRTCRCRPALIPGGAWTTKDQQKALMRVGRSLLAGDGRYPHLEKLLRREPPLGGARVQCEGLEAMGRLVREVEGSYLFVQGPPGSGKTWTGRAAHHVPDRAREAGRRSPRRATRRSTSCSRRSRPTRSQTGVALRGLKKATRREPRLVLRGRRARRERRERGRLRRRRPRPLRRHRLALQRARSSTARSTTSSSTRRARPRSRTRSRSGRARRRSCCSATRCSSRR